MGVETSPVERVLKKQRIIAQRMFDATAYPTNRYQLVDNDKQFQLTVDVPGVQEGDIDIKLDDGQLTVQGKRVSASDSSRFTSQFSQSFYLDPTVDVDNFRQPSRTVCLSFPPQKTWPSWKRIFVESPSHLLRTSSPRMMIKSWMMDQCRLRQQKEEMIPSGWILKPQRMPITIRKTIIETFNK